MSTIAKPMGTAPHRALLMLGSALTVLVALLAATTAVAHGARASSAPAPANTAVLTQKYNTTRNGWNPNETPARRSS